MSGPRRFSEAKLVIASHNRGKVGEIADLLQPFAIQLLSAGDLNLPEPVEDGATFAANAEIKARAVAGASGLPALADDSGLCVAALGGKPGVHSARWAGPDKDFSLAMARIHEALAETTDRRAHFICALALCWPDDHLVCFEGRVDGQLVWPPVGDKGFGYDPIFVPDGHRQTFAQMDPAKKHAMSHRADAFRQLVSTCFAEA